MRTFIRIMLPRAIRIADARRHMHADTSRGLATLAHTGHLHVDTDRMLDNRDAGTPGGVCGLQRTLVRYRLALDRRSHGQGGTRSSLVPTLYAGYGAYTHRRCGPGT